MMMRIAHVSTRKSRSIGTVLESTSPGTGTALGLMVHALASEPLKLTKQGL